MLNSDLSKVSVQDVLSVLSTLKTYYQKRNDEVKTDVELYQQSYTLSLPDGVVGIKSPTTKSLPDRAADRLGGARVQAHMEPRRPGNKETERIEKMEHAAVAIFELARRRSKYNPKRALALHGFNRGGMVLKVQLDESCTYEEPKRENSTSDFAWEMDKKLARFRQLERFPLILDARPIESVFPDPETDGDNFVIEYYQRRWGDVMKNYPNARDFMEGLSFPRDTKGRYRNKTFKEDETVEYIEVWTRDWRGVIVEGQWMPIGDFPAGPIPNAYGRPPYFLRYSGFGDPAGKPEEKCVSVLRGVRDVAKMESRLLTIVDDLAEKEAYGATVIDEEDETAKQTMSFAPGAVIETGMKDAARRPQAYKPQNNIGEALQALQVAGSHVERGAVPSEAIGQPSPQRSGTPTGVAAALLTGQASMIIDPVKGALEDLLMDAMPFIFYILDTKYDGKLTLYGQVGQDSYVNLDLDSSVIDGHYGPVWIDLKLQAPEQNYASWNLGISAMQALGPQPWIFEKFFGQENAEALSKEMLVRQLVHSDMTKQYLNQRLIEALQAKANNTADRLPGQNVPAPGPIPQDPMLAAGAPPMDPMLRASAGVSPSPVGQPAVTTAPVMQ